MKNKIYKISIGLLSIWFMAACTDLNPVFKDKIASENFFQTESDFEQATAACYGQLQTLSWFGYWFTTSQNSDETCTPSREGGGWDDGGTHRNMELHDVQPEQGWPINGVWNNMMSAIAVINSSINGLSAASADETVKSKYLAEMRTLRAYFYWLAIDLYGDIPLVLEAQDANDPMGNTPRSETVQFLLEELDWVLGQDIPEGYVSNPSWFPRVTKTTAKAIKAKILINAGVYTGTERYAETLDLLEEILNTDQESALYGGNYFDLFGVNNENRTDEFVFYADLSPTDMSTNYGNFWPHFSFHGALTQKYSMAGGPWGGISIENHFYQSFDANDQRREGILVGPQSFDDGSPLYEDPNAASPVQLDLNPVFPLRNAPANAGGRIAKWETDPTAINNRMHNGWPIIRHADLLLMAAECELRVNGTSAAADAYVNQVRARAFEPDMPLSNVTLDDVFDERGFELYTEGHRRMDQIRFDKWDIGDFAGDAEYNDASTTTVWPIPEFALNANKNLNQNDGYGN
ncbi:RagB/SusD family nutrient uptake outer membrane protein [Reichenbachiella ulvae]|uniref:RagB/SusD family nutrient uptake outer membrane protein n=1 Tax=Reichenbachiella ulvae TaxID=2980104 RepID=A0ABT3D0F0_9BACT|nr:RagB/SusD family nutrient uptake outer membrane protein [Reichenbachiella ulvae]MCV9389296.1 RagB/SusD family nutrient uptake outer membrane protein [Reichenbachiella ulvae]